MPIPLPVVNWQTTVSAPRESISSHPPRLGCRHSTRWLLCRKRCHAILLVCLPSSNLNNIWMLKRTWQENSKVQFITYVEHTKYTPLTCLSYHKIAVFNDQLMLKPGVWSNLSVFKRDYLDFIANPKWINLITILVAADYHVLTLPYQCLTILVTGLT